MWKSATGCARSWCEGRGLRVPRTPPAASPALTYGDASWSSMQLVEWARAVTSPSQQPHQAAAQPQWNSSMAPRPRRGTAGSTPSHVSAVYARLPHTAQVQSLRTEMCHCWVGEPAQCRVHAGLACVPPYPACAPAVHSCTDPVLAHRCRRKGPQAAKQCRPLYVQGNCLPVFATLRMCWRMGPAHAGRWA